MSTSNKLAFEVDEIGDISERDLIEWAYGRGLDWTKSRDRVGMSYSTAQIKPDGKISLISKGKTLKQALFHAWKRFH